jgi:hypothetical protein
MFAEVEDLVSVIVINYASGKVSRIIESAYFSQFINVIFKVAVSVGSCDLRTSKVCSRIGF